MRRSAAKRTPALEPVRTLRFAAGVVGLALVAAACGGSTPTAGSSPPGQSTAASGSATPALVAATASGGQLDFGALEGTDYVLWFWAPW